MLTREENETLCRVGPGTKMGRVMRRYWHPIAVSEQLPAPTAIRCASPCSARSSSRSATVRAASAFSTNSACIAARRSRWLASRTTAFAASITAGNSASTGRYRRRQTIRTAGFASASRRPAIPCARRAGSSGPISATRRRFRRSAASASWTRTPSNRTVIRVNVDCNYLQLWEGGADSSHVGVLHSNVARPGWLDNDFRARRGRRQSGQSRGRGQCADPGDRGHRLRFPLRRRASRPRARRRPCRQEHSRRSAHHALCAHHPRAELLLPCLRDAGQPTFAPAPTSSSTATRR